MSIDIRLDVARYYDYNPGFPKDILFYVENIPSQKTNVLELGCGTGRVIVPLSQYCKSICGIDLSDIMIAICEEKLEKERIPSSKVTVTVGDITDFNLKQKFDLILAPFRVFQNLETNGEIEGFFECVRKHLAPQGTCILNVFNPNKDRKTLIREWCTERENLNWEEKTDGGKVTCNDRRPRMDKEKLILYPELIYRRYRNEVIVDEAILKIVMRCYYPREFEKLITAHGFSIINRWGGYGGELYGKGPELVLEFKDGI